MRKTIILLTILSITILSISLPTNAQAIEISNKTKIIAGSCAGLTGATAAFYCYKKAKSYARALQLLDQLDIDQLDIEKDDQTKASLKRKQSLCTILTIIFAQVAITGVGVAAWGGWGCLHSDNYVGTGNEPGDNPEETLNFFGLYRDMYNLYLDPHDRDSYTLIIKDLEDKELDKYQVDASYLERLQKSIEFFKKMQKPEFKTPTIVTGLNNPELTERQAEFKEYKQSVNDGIGCPRPPWER
ncbi:MAG: hypothetical protein KAU22_07515 [Desulfuromonadales bacterium]|nr:hypothetical protein [Desulfuromonadales bacterium]